MNKKDCVDLEFFHNRPVTITGIDMVTEVRPESWYDDNSEAYYVEINNVIYMFQEDPDDGYRSCLEDEVRIIKDYKIKNKIPPVVCRGEYHDNDDANILNFVDIVSKKVILSVGTDSTDDYYPCCILEWRPDNIHYNIGR